jgi:hypothetical protein
MFSWLSTELWVRSGRFWLLISPIHTRTFAQATDSMDSFYELLTEEVEEENRFSWRASKKKSSPSQNKG